MGREVNLDSDKNETVIEWDEYVYKNIAMQLE